MTKFRFLFIIVLAMSAFDIVVNAVVKLFPMLEVVGISVFALLDVFIIRGLIRVKNGG